MISASFEYDLYHCINMYAFANGTWLRHVSMGLHGSGTCYPRATECQLFATHGKFLCNLLLLFYPLLPEGLAENKWLNLGGGLSKDKIPVAYLTLLLVRGTFIRYFSKSKD